MFKQLKSNFTKASNEQSDIDGKNAGSMDSEKVSIKKIRAMLYEESMHFSEHNTYYKSSNLQNYNNIDAYMDRIKKSNYARSYEQENIYNEALNLYNNRNVYIKKKYLNDFYSNIKRNLYKSQYFGDYEDDMEQEQHTDGRQAHQQQPQQLEQLEHQGEKDEGIADKERKEGDDEASAFLVAKESIVERKIYEYLYKERKREQLMMFNEKYKDLFRGSRGNLKNGNEMNGSRKILRRHDSVSYAFMMTNNGGYNSGNNNISNDISSNENRDNNNIGYSSIGNNTGNSNIGNNNIGYNGIGNNTGNSNIGNNNNTNILADLRELHSMSDSNSYKSEKEENFLETLIKLRYTPEHISQLSDLFENPKTLKKVNMKILRWLDYQLINGYWLERLSLFLLGLTIAIGVGNIETFWCLMSTWHGVIFVLPYILCYSFVCHPILSFELYIGQLVRASSPFIFYKLLKQCASVGFLMVLTCLINSYINTYRISAEYFIYLINSFKRELPWKLNQSEIQFCTNFKDDFLSCHKYRPLCLFSKNTSSCVPNSLGKAFLIYHNKFFPKNRLYEHLLHIDNSKNYVHIFSNGNSYIDKDTFICLFICNFLVTIFQLCGLTHFAFSSALVLLLIGCLSVTQFASMFNLSSAFQAYSQVLKSWEFSYLYTYSSIWSQCVSFALYELSIGMGIYSSLATKTRIGTNLTLDGYAITVWNSIISSLMFFSAVSVIGFIAKSINSNFMDMLEFSRKDCSFILFPVGFTYLQKMEKTLCMLYYGSYTILSCATLAIQCEVLVMTIRDFKFTKNVKKRTIILSLSLLFFFSSFFISNIDSKNVIWFLSFTISENGRVFVSLMICIILGWLYNIEAQFKGLTTRSVLTFNITYWTLNLFFSLLFNYLPYHVYVLYMIRLAIFLVSTLVALLVLKMEVAQKKGQLEHIYNKLTYKKLLYVLYLGNIEVLRKELQRIISGTLFMGSISIMWSICIKYIGTSILLSAFIEFADGIFYSNELRRKVFERLCTYEDYFADFSLLPSKPLKETQNFNILMYFYEFRKFKDTKKAKKKKISIN
ncbi:transporter [Plasmodium brasilianum]|nr:transporter [Plasmodium brasilianum]